VNTRWRFLVVDFNPLSDESFEAQIHGELPWCDGLIPEILT
jgi:hypothetical protein